MRLPAPPPPQPRRWCGYLLLALGALLLAAAVTVTVLAPEEATVQVPLGRRGLRSTQVGPWALFVAPVLTLLGAWYALTGLSAPQHRGARVWWALLAGLAPAALLAVLAQEVLD